MREFLITSSFLILIILILRIFIKNRISAGIQYAIWLLVVLKLMIPVNIINSSFSIYNVFTDNIKILSDDYEKSNSYKDNLIVKAPVNYKKDSEFDNKNHVKMIGGLSNRELILFFIWFSGFIICTTIFIIVNIVFYKRLKRERISLLKKKGNISIYLVKNIPSPCLFGIFNPKIYINQESLKEKNLNYVLTHEYQHYKHLDHIWSLVRQISLAVYWFHPLVWVAAIVSKYDCEISCDESTIKSIGNSERINYGRAIIDMASQEKSNSKFGIMAVSMVREYYWIKGRIIRINTVFEMHMKNLIIFIIMIIITIIFTFIGSKESYIYVNSFKRYFNEDLSLAIKYDKYKTGYINKKGEEVIPCIYESGEPFSEGKAPVMQNGKWGYINKDCEEVIPFLYDNASSFSEGLAAITLDDKCGYIDSNGEIVIPFLYDYAWDFTEGKAAVEKDGKWGYIDKDGKVIIPFIYDMAYYFNEGKAPVQKGDKWGYIDEQGAEVFPFIYESARMFSDGLAQVKYNGKYGCINENGDVIIPFIYDNARQFSEGLIPVKKHSKWGYINKNGEEVIPFIYDDAEHFTENIAVVCNNGKMQYIELPDSISENN